MNWLSEHMHHPWPTKQEKKELCALSGLTPKQLRIWFTNNRKRKLNSLSKTKNVTYSPATSASSYMTLDMDHMGAMEMAQQNMMINDMQMEALNAQFQAQMSEMSKYCMCDLYQLCLGLNLMTSF